MFWASHPHSRLERRGEEQNLSPLEALPFYYPEAELQSGSPWSGVTLLLPAEGRCEEHGSGVMNDCNFLLRVFWHFLNQTRHLKKVFA